MNLSRSETPLAGRTNLDGFQGRQGRQDLPRQQQGRLQVKPYGMKET